MSSIPERDGVSRTLHLPARSRPMLVDAHQMDVDRTVPPERVWQLMREQTQKFRDSIPFGCGRCHHAIWHRALPPTSSAVAQSTRDVKKYLADNEPHVTCGIGVRTGGGVAYCSRSTAQPVEESAEA